MSTAHSSVAPNRRAFLSLAAAGSAAFLATVLVAPTPAAAISELQAIELEAQELARLDGISSYINSITTMQGEFVQIGPDGGRAQGLFVISRPGKLLFRYSPPSRLEIVSDGKAVLVRDRALETNDLYTIGQTPMRFLIEPDLNLRRDSTILDVRQDGQDITVVIEEETPVGTGQIAVTVNAEDYALRQWTVTDPQGLNTTVAVYNVEFGLPTDPAWFRINRFEVMGRQ